MRDCISLTTRWKLKIIKLIFQFIDALKLLSCYFIWHMLWRSVISKSKNLIALIGRTHFLLILYLWVCFQGCHSVVPVSFFRECTVQQMWADILSLIKLKGKKCVCFNICQRATILSICISAFVLSELWFENNIHLVYRS